VEEISLECYARGKPGRFQRLRILRESERFPATVIAYRTGRLSEETLRAFRIGLSEAHRSAGNRELLTCLRISAFTVVPADYRQSLQETAKLYPAPSGAAQMVTMRSLLRQTNRLVGQTWSSLASARPGSAALQIRGDQAQP
jgi:hypothetical protein